MARWLEFSGPDDDATRARARAIDGCGSYLVFRRLLEGEGRGDTHLHAASFCKQHLLCPFCAIRRAAKYCGAYSDRVLTHAMTKPKDRLAFVTFTVVDGPDLVERFEHLHQSMRSLMERRRKARSKSSRNVSAMRIIEGGVGAYEVKRGKNSKQWHPHYHGIWIASERIDFGWMQREWADVTEDSTFCHIKYLDEYLAFAYGAMTWAEYVDRLPRAFVEVFKYPLKFSDLSFEDNWTSHLTLKGRRLVNGFGCLRGVEPDPSLTDEAVNWDIVEFEELCYLFRDGYYTRVGESEMREERRQTEEVVARPQRIDTRVERDDFGFAVKVTHDEVS